MARKRGVWIVSIIVFLLSLIFAETWVLSLEHKLRGRILRVQVVIIIQALLSIMTVFLWKSLSNAFNSQVKDQPKNTHRFQLVWKCLLLCYMLLAHCSYMANVFLVRTEPTVIALVCYLFLGFHVQMFAFLIVVKIINLIFKCRQKQGIRRDKAAVLAMIYAISLTSYGYYNINHPPVVKTVHIPIKNLPSHLDSFTISLLSDIHIGPTVGRKQLETAVSISNSLQPDIVLIAGDLVDGLVSDLKHAIQPIQHLQSKYGVLYVTGNHEYYTMDVENWFEKLKEFGIKVLHNSNVKVPPDETNDRSLCFVGTDDLEADRIRYSGHGMKLDQAMEGCSNEQNIILLAHQPGAAKQALLSSHKIDLILSGHTHGGQMFPLVIGAYLMNPFYAGLYQRGGTYIYVSQGTYYWGMPIRTLTQHEITNIKLISA